jgi:hypothetical protein
MNVNCSVGEGCVRSYRCVNSVMDFTVYFLNVNFAREAVVF